MATITWAGGTSTDANVAANWTGGSKPTSSDEVHFDGTCTRVCDMTNLGDQTYQAIHIHSDYFIFGGATTPTVTFSAQTITLTNGIGLTIDKSGVLDCNETVFTFTGTASGDNYDSAGSVNDAKYFIKIDSTNDNKLDVSDLGVFVNETDREQTTFNYTPSATSKITLMNGVYPKVTIAPTSGTTTFYTSNDFQTYTASAIPQRTKLSSYPKVSMLAFDVSSSSVTTTPLTRNLEDKLKVFRIKNGITGVGGSTFDWGYTTLELEPSTSGNHELPTTGDTSYGSSSELFTARYHKIIIDEAKSNNRYFTIDANTRLYCNTLIINGRFYGNIDYHSSSSAEIHTVNRVIVNGDWNFQQISDGVYRVRGTQELSPVAYGGTGRRFLTTDSILYGRGSNEVGLTTKILHPIFFERSAIDTSAVDFRSPTATGSTAYPNAFPMPYAGKVVAATFLFAGSAITTTGNTNVIRIRKNGGTSGSDINDVSFNEGDLTNTNGTNYSLVETGLTFSFSAGDILQVKRQSGATDLNNGQAILWVKFDY